MINRREFIQLAMAAGAAVAVPSSVEIAPVRSGGNVPNRTLYKVPYDEAFSDALIFASEARRLGAHTHAIRGDVTDLWFQDLSRKWAQSPASIAGMTTCQSLFVLALMARDARMRAVYQGDSRWPRIAANVVMSWRPEESHTRRDAKAAAGPPALPTTLCSWIIAPINREHGRSPSSSRRAVLFQS